MNEKWNVDTADFKNGNQMLVHIISKVLKQTLYVLQYLRNILWYYKY